ncbi:MAG: hypothetical protein AABY15_03990 [Nanoarchaeota archaeon]
MADKAKGVRMKVWLFGEAEFETTETFQQNYERLFDVAEACGYMISKDNKCGILLVGSDNEEVRIQFEPKLKIIKCQRDDSGRIIEPFHEVVIQ